MDFTRDPSSDPLRVALVSPGWPVDRMANGVVSYTATLVGALRGMGVDAHVLTPRPMREPCEDFVHEIRTRDRSLKSRVMWKLRPRVWPVQSFCSALLHEVRQLHREVGIQVLELEESYGWARLLAGRCPVPMVVRLHGPWFLNGSANGAPPDADFRRRDAWERAGLLRADAITAPSQSVLDEARRHFGLALPDARVIPNPVQPTAAEGRWSLQGCDQKRIAFVGRFDRHKGGDLVLDAFARVLKAVPDARLDFIGPDRGFADESGREWKFDEFLRARLGEADRGKVHFHGFQPGAVAATLRNRAMVTVVPSRYETFGIAAAEAMAAGCPLVVSGAGALTELVRDGVDGSVAAPGDPAGLAEKVLAMMNHPRRAAEMGRRAAEAAQRFAPDAVARASAEMYRQARDRAGRANSRPGRKIPA